MNTLYVYNVITRDVVQVVTGASNEECEEKAGELGYMGTDEYGATYCHREEIL